MFGPINAPIMGHRHTVQTHPDQTLQTAASDLGLHCLHMKVGYFLK